MPDDGPRPSDPLDADLSSPDTHSESEPNVRPLKLGRRPVVEIIRGLVLGASMAAFERLATTDAEREAGVWLMSEPEAADIADPLAAIATRHAGGALINPDAADLVKAGVAAGAYLISNTVDAVRIRWALHRARRQGLATEPDPREETP